MRADPICKGEDFHALMSNTSVDIGSVHLYPEFWSVCTEYALSPAASHHLTFTHGLAKNVL